MEATKSIDDCNYYLDKKKQRVFFKWLIGLVGQATTAVGKSASLDQQSSWLEFARGTKHMLRAITSYSALQNVE